MWIVKDEMIYITEIATTERKNEIKCDLHYVLYLTYYCVIINFNLNS